MSFFVSKDIKGLIDPETFYQEGSTGESTKESSDYLGITTLAEDLKLRIKEIEFKNQCKYKFSRKVIF